jgi:hypothetical protein
VTVSLPAAPAIVRGIAGVLVAGGITAIVFLICVEGSFHKGITDFDFAHILGTAIEGTATEKTGGQALAVIGDSVGPTALWTTIACGIVLLAFHALVIVRLVRWGWVVQGLVLGLVLFLAIGLIYVPFVDARLDTPIGPWGADQGGWTPFVFAASSVIATLIGVRCYDLMARASWWQEESVGVEEQLAELAAVEGSLELPEQGPEEGLVRH